MAPPVKCMAPPGSCCHRPHMLQGALLPEYDPVTKISIIPRGAAEGEGPAWRPRGAAWRPRGRGCMAPRGEAPLHRPMEGTRTEGRARGSGAAAKPLGSVRTRTKSQLHGLWAGRTYSRPPREHRFCITVRLYKRDKDQFIQGSATSQFGSFMSLQSLKTRKTMRRHAVSCHVSSLV